MDRKSMMLNMLKRISFPGEVVSGADAIRRLQTLPQGKLSLLCSTTVRTSEAGDKILDLLQKGGMDYEVLDAPSGEPNIATVQAISEQLASFKPAWIVAIGGGSILDAAKIAWAIYEHPELDFSQPPPLSIPGLRKKAKLILVPTTTGTGSESSQTAILKSENDDVVYPYVSTEWIPDIAVLDPKLTLSLSPELVAQTAMDALAHAIEAYVSRLAGTLVKNHAATAVRMILDNLQLAHDTDQLDARENLMIGAHMAGLAQSAASTGAAHALTHATSAITGASHSSGISLFLYPTMVLNRQKSHALYDSLSAEIDRTSSQLIDSIDQLRESLSLPRRLTEITDLEINDSMISDISERAQTDICMRTAPQRLQADELRASLVSLT